MKKNKIYIIISFLILFNIQIFGSQVWRSLIVPGWGEKKLNHNKRANTLLFTEYGLWSVFIFSGYQSSSYKNDYKNHGSYYANVDWVNKNDLYAANVGNYNSFEEYNEIKAREGLFDDRYPINEGYDWDWESREERLQYDRWRNKSKNYGEMKGFIIAGMLINRMISIIDVFILEKNGKLNSELVRNSDNSVNLNIHYNF